MYATILAATDGSDHARRALTEAAGLARALGSRLHVIHCPQVETAALMAGSMVAVLDAIPDAEEIEKAGREVLDNARTWVEEQGWTVEDLHLRQGDPADEIIDCARQIGAELIVVGRRGVGAVRAAVFGSVSHEIAYRARLPLLTVG